VMSLLIPGIVWQLGSLPACRSTFITKSCALQSKLPQLQCHLQQLQSSCSAPVPLSERSNRCSWRRPPADEVRGEGSLRYHKVVRRPSLKPHAATWTSIKAVNSSTSTPTNLTVGSLSNQGVTAMLRCQVGAGITPGDRRCTNHIPCWLGHSAPALTPEGCLP